MDLPTGSIGVQCEVEGVALFLAVGDPSGTLDDVSGRDAIVGTWRLIPSCCWYKLEGMVFFHQGAGNHLFILTLCCIQVWLDV